MSVDRVHFVSMSREGGLRSTPSTLSLPTPSRRFVPLLLGRGVRLRDGLEDHEMDYQAEANPVPSGVTHVTFSLEGVQGAPR